MIHIAIGHNPELQAAQIPVYIILCVEVESGAIQDFQAAAGRVSVKTPSIINDLGSFLYGVRIAQREIRFHILEMMQENDLIRSSGKNGYSSQEEDY
jgi:hypothetical protein